MLPVVSKRRPSGFNSREISVTTSFGSGVFDDFNAGDDIKTLGRQHLQAVAVIKFKTLIF